MKNLLHLFGGLIAMASIAPVFAETTHVTIDLTDGTKFSYLLAELPKITYSTDSLIVSGPARAAFGLNTVDSYYFTDGTVSDALVLGSNEVRITYSDNSHVKAEGLQPYSSVILYSVAGSAIQKVNASAEGVAELGLPQSKGVYILKTDSQTVKLIKE
ncbi:MAG: hypothetical protein IKK68_03565 [Paludibacteraceae bacterium]|nr:hypothetical protein [Paludibacteraceae bacterium]